MRSTWPRSEHGNQAASNRCRYQNMHRRKPVSTSSMAFRGPVANGSDPMKLLKSSLKLATSMQLRSKFDVDAIAYQQTTWGASCGVGSSVSVPVRVSACAFAGSAIVISAGRNGAGSSSARRARRGHRHAVFARRCATRSRSSAIPSRWSTRSPPKTSAISPTRTSAKQFSACPACRSIGRTVKAAASAFAAPTSR